jgi:hypothetical protein
MNAHSKSVEFEAADPIRRGSSVPAASLLFHAGRSHVVRHGGSDERDLLARGALRIGMVLFHRPARDFQPAGSVAPLDASHLQGAWGSGHN